MRLQCSSAIFLLLSIDPIASFSSRSWGKSTSTRSSESQLYVSIGLGPDKDSQTDAGKKELIPGVDYEVPDHEAYRTSRRSKLDEKCDRWFGALLGGEDDKGIMGDLADDMRTLLLTPVPLVNEIRLPYEHEDYTPYVNTKLPWTPLTPAFGLEEFGLPVPRRNAEAWRQFDVPGLVDQDYSGSVEGNGSVMELSEEDVASYQKSIETSGVWLDDDSCHARLVYINGRYVPQLSKTNDFAQNLNSLDGVSEETKGYLARLTDGFTDELAAKVPIGDDQYWTSFKKLSKPDHNVGEPTSQFAINTQQGTACFAALNTRKTGAVAHIHIPEGFESDVEQTKPVILINAVTKDGGAAAGSAGVSFHPRCLVVAEESSKLAFVQASVDLDSGSEHVPKLYNGYTQFFVKENATVTHTFLDESGGIVTSGVEKSDDQFAEGEKFARYVEAERPELKDTHFETIDAHMIGDNASYKAAMFSLGGSGRIRMGHSVSLLRPETHTTIHGFQLCGGAQRHECKTNVHHIGQGTTSEQVHKNMVGGRATGAFRGRIRVEQSAQQTNSQQLSRTVLLTDRCRAWAVPSLEIIADDVECTHGATVSDLSEEQLFYLKSRGLSTDLARNILMYAFADEIVESADPSMLAKVGTEGGLQKRLISKMENLVPTGPRAIMGEFQSI